LLCILFSAMLRALGRGVRAALGARAAPTPAGACGVCSTSASHDLRDFLEVEGADAASYGAAAAGAAGGGTLGGKSTVSSLLASRSARRSPPLARQLSSEKALRSLSLPAAASERAATRHYSPTVAAAAAPRCRPPPRRTGRAWLASELRNKSWSDLHKLWYVCVKERNMVATQLLWAGAQGAARDDYIGRSRQVRLTMNRIKQVMAERATQEPNAVKRLEMKKVIHVM
jgi:large subunit ribosomal protein L47